MRNPLVDKFCKKIPSFFSRFFKGRKEDLNQSAFDFLSSRGIQTELGYVHLGGLPIVYNHENSKIFLGKNVVLLSDSQHNLAGINHPVILATCAEGAEIIIKDGSGLSGTSVVSVKYIEIGHNVNVGVNVNIYDTDFHPINFIERRKNPGFDLSKISYAPVIIGDDVWIGANSIILKGVKLGERTIVAAGSVVTKSFPSDSLIGGNPAKLIRKLN